MFSNQPISVPCQAILGTSEFANLEEFSAKASLATLRDHVGAMWSTSRLSVILLDFVTRTPALEHTMAMTRARVSALCNTVGGRQ